MECKIEGCSRDAMYKKKQLCQKHYFRIMRNGTSDLLERDYQKAITPNGYVTIHASGHPIAIMAGRGRVFEHRVSYYDNINTNPTECDLCKMDVNWLTLHIDHINGVRTDNDPSNLRCLCRGCNTGLGYTETSYGTEIECRGQAMTPTAWSRQDGVNVCGATIRRRVKNGLSAEDAIFGSKATHINFIPDKTKNKREQLKEVTT